MASCVYPTGELQAALLFERNLQCDLIYLTLHYPLSDRSLPTIVILNRHILRVVFSVSTGVTQPDTVTGKCDPLPLATQCGLRPESLARGQQ